MNGICHNGTDPRRWRDVQKVGEKGITFGFVLMGLNIELGSRNGDNVMKAVESALTVINPLPLDADR